MWKNIAGGVSNSTDSDRHIPSFFYKYAIWFAQNSVSTILILMDNMVIKKNCIVWSSQYNVEINFVTNMGERAFNPLLQ